eukprot:Phypoly_transcript_03517.p1 GENE.Phypoly_transcript_03517~~Phypoly_transcript_03517.p1  ORF type:complete len:684 (+),score=166.84 Phypoly_transcript_03517:196-2052(+)
MEIIPKWKASLSRLHQQFQTKKEVQDKTYNASNVGVLDDIDASSFGVSDNVSQAAKKRRFKVDLPTDEDDTTTKIDHAALLKKARSENSASGKGNTANGHTDDAQANGHANGHVIGHVNGAVNGSANGHHEDGEKKATRFIPVLDDVWSSSQEDADASFALRPNPGKVELTLQPTMKPADDADYELWEDVENSVKITIEKNSAVEPYRFMSDETERNANVLDDRLVTLGNQIQEEHMLPRPEMFHIPAQDPVVAMGRICAENDEVFGDKSVVLEADEERTKARVSLEFKHMTEKGFSVFPGQIVIVEGVNLNGRSITVTDFYEPKYMPLYKNPTYVPPRAHPYAPLNILVAAGPFTTTENLAYRPLDHLLEVVERTNPQIVVLLGPFVDTAQALVQSSDETFAELFKSKISATLMRATGTLSTMSLPPSKIVLVPHPRDPEMSPLPQPPFSAKEYQMESKWITPVSNPCTMKVNDVTLGVSSVDVIRHLASQEASKNLQGDRLSRLCGHLLKQRSYYPLYPPSAEVCVEVTKSEALDLPYAPDLLIVPSDLQHFIKNVNDTICINPGRLSRGKTGGTYAKVTVFPQKREEGDKEGEEEKKQSEAVRVSHRTKVEIVRI